MGEELKPCPFCGCAATLRTLSATCFKVGCVGCGVELVPQFTPGVAIQRWNTRAWVAVEAACNAGIKGAVDAALEIASKASAREVDRVRREHEDERDRLARELAEAQTAAKNWQTAAEANRDAAMGYQDRAIAAERELDLARKELERHRQLVEQMVHQLEATEASLRYRIERARERVQNFGKTTESGKPESAEG